MLSNFFILMVFTTLIGALTLSALPWRLSTCTDCSCPINVVTCGDVCSICTCTNTTIDCRAKKIKKSFSSNLTDWALEGNLAVDTLDLSHNQIGRVVGLPSLPIKRLNLASNLISEIDFSAFYKLANIEELDLSYNQIAFYDLLGDEFRGPYSEIYYEPLPLKSLNISNNILSRLNADIFEHLPFLERLSISRNPLGPQLDQGTIVAISSVTKLQLLDLSYTELTVLPAFLQNLPDLRELDLSNNNFLRVPNEGLAHAPALQILHLDGNPINALPTSRPFTEMPTLEQLHISHMHLLTRIESKALQGLTGLKYLSCHNNLLLSTISPEALSSTHIIKLDLHDNNLKYLPEKLLKNWTNVEVDIRGNDISCDCDNQWILTKLVKQMKDKAEGLVCSEPRQMIGTALSKLADSKYEMRCLDYYGNHPERDGSFLIATFVIVIIAMASLGAYFVLRNRMCNKKQEIDYTAIYQRHVQDDGDNRF